MKRLFYSFALVLGAFFLPSVSYASSVWTLPSGTVIFGFENDSPSSICSSLQSLIGDEFSNIRSCTIIEPTVLQYLYSTQSIPSGEFQGFLYLVPQGSSHDDTPYCAVNPENPSCSVDPDPDPDPDPPSGIPESALDNYVGCEQWAQSQCIARNENFLNSYWSYGNCTYSCIEHYDVTATAPASPSQLNSIFERISAVDSGVRNVHNSVNTEIRRLSTNLANQVHGSNQRIYNLSGDISNLDYRLYELTGINQDQNSQLYDIGFTVNSNQGNILGLHQRFNAFKDTLDNLPTGGDGTSPDYTNLLNAQIGATYDVMGAVYDQTNNLLIPLNGINANISGLGVSLDNVTGELQGIHGALSGGVIGQLSGLLSESAQSRDSLASIESALTGDVDYSDLDFSEFGGDGYDEGSDGRQSILDAFGLTGNESWDDIETTEIDLDDHVDSFDFRLPDSSCPAPLVFTIRRTSIEYSYQPLCDIFEQLGVFVLLSAYFMTPFIVFGAKK